MAFEEANNIDDIRRDIGDSDIAGRLGCLATTVVFDVAIGRWRNGGEDEHIFIRQQVPIGHFDIIDIINGVHTIDQNTDAMLTGIFNNGAAHGQGTATDTAEFTFRLVTLDINQNMQVNLLIYFSLV